MRGVQRPAARDDVDELEVCESEQYREGHHHRDDGCEQWQCDVVELLPRCGAINR